ncbi:hypothetical protein ACPPVO_36460 [Dactylosporangium sp. McL0621]|uniref:hypothetical protein n=1 Tax=Dactylosporangium sp. McL0621 TaxID=3415678 RepID=UPI003CFB964B
MLPKTLAEPGRYRIESTWPLADEVRKRLLHDGGPSVEVRPVAELLGVYHRQPVRPQDLLLSLGKTTSALPGLGNAGAAGLAGLTALRTASRWAIVRYLWAFSDQRPELCLSALTDQVRQHQRSLLSEHFGIALATDVVEQSILRRPASVVDADAVSYDRFLARAMRDLQAHKPDYFWYRHEHGQLSEVMVVEAKGTSSGRSHAIKQLARGVAQVLVPTNIAGVSMRRIVVGARFIGGKIHAHAIEVGESDADARREAVDVIRRQERQPVPAAYRQENEDLLTFVAPVDSAVAAAELDIEDQARLYAFAGRPAVRDMLRTSPQLIQGQVDDLELVYADDTTFRCESTRIAFGGQTVHVRTGVAEELLVPPASAPAQGFVRRRASYQERRGASGNRLVQGEASGRPVQVLTSLDGCMLSVEVE